jgi:hypothetical protein
MIVSKLRQGRCPLPLKLHRSLFNTECDQPPFINRNMELMVPGSSSQQRRELRTTLCSSMPSRLFKTSKVSRSANNSTAPSWRKWVDSEFFNRCLTFYLIRIFDLLNSNQPRSRWWGCCTVSSLMLNCEFVNRDGLGEIDHEQED